MKKLLKALALILWMILIFTLSNQSGTSSQGLSDGILMRVALFISRFREMDVRAFVLDTGYYIRKGAHIFEYAVLYILSYECLKDYSVKRVKILCLVFCVLYAFFDEFHQLFIDGRSGELNDCLIDSIGSLLSFLFWHKIFKE